LVKQEPLLELQVREELEHQEQAQELF